MWFKMINESFDCENCHEEVKKHPQWSARNHCPSCLYSKHLDKDFPWDRASICLWIMKPVWIDFKKNKWNMIKHKCEKCSKEILNKVSDDDDFLEFMKKINKSL
jgi:DNA-directed RNA polymerase subunit RPC12/RpoP